MNKMIVGIIFVFTTSLSAMERKEWRPIEKWEDELKQFQERLWRLGKMEVANQRLKLKPKCYEQIKNMAVADLEKGKQEKGSQQYMSIAAYQKMMRTRKKEQQQKQTSMLMCSKFKVTNASTRSDSSFIRRYLVHDHKGNNIVYEEHIEPTALPKALLKQIQNVQRNYQGKPIYLEIEQKENKNNILYVHASRRTLDIYKERQGYWINYKNLSEVLYNTMYSKTLQDCMLRFDDEPPNQILILAYGGTEELYVCKEGDRFALFGVFLDSDSCDAEYQLHTNQGVYKFAEKLAEVTKPK